MKFFLRWFLFSLAFVPLFVNADTLFPFIFTKTLVIRTAIALFATVFSVWFFMERRGARLAIERIKQFFKNPVFLFTSLFLLLLFVSALLAENPYKAFFGDIERGEGFLGILNFFGFFVAALLVFDKDDWATFFRLNLVTGAILLVDSIGEIASGGFIRAQSFIGNPTFLAGYFLFVMFSALVAFALSKNRKGWRAFSFLMIFGGVFGVFLTGTRGAIFGLLVGAFLSLLYFAFKGKGVDFRLFGGKRISVQKASVAILLFVLLGIGAFLAARENPFWQNVPGLDRFATITFDDNTIQTRLISAGVSMNAVDPGENGLGRFLIGWGQDNFNIAYNKYYNPEYMRYESLWFDRAHNKILDVLVMQGALGLLAYAGMWASVFYLAFKKIPEKEYAAPLLFFGSAYFVQNLFVFDQISTWIPFFGFLAFSVFAGTSSSEFHNNNRNRKHAPEPRPRGEARSGGAAAPRAETLLSYALPLISLFFLITLVLYAFVPYAQSILFIEGLKSGNAEEMLARVSKFSEPYNYAQSTIRNRLLAAAQSLIGSPEGAGLVATATELQEEFVNREPYDPRDISLLSTVYRMRAGLGEPGAGEKAVGYAKLALSLSPKRQNLLYDVGTLYADRGDFANMQRYAAELIAGSPDVPRTKILYSTLVVREGSNRYAEAMGILNSAVRDPGVYFLGDQEVEVLRTVYSLFLDYFSEIRDEELFLAALEGVRDLELKVEEIDGRLFAIGQIDALPPERSGELERNIMLFRENRWAALEIAE